MRRNRNTGRMSGGGGGSGGRDLNMSGGPLLTEHLKGIDLELELLKRKREMLEQQQSQLNQPFYQLPQASYYNSGPSHDYSNMYNDGPQQNHKPFSRKRPAINVWENDPFIKRPADPFSKRLESRGYSGPSSTRNQPFNAPSQQKAAPFNRFGQGKQIGQKFSYPKQTPKFVANKITKPGKTAPPPNKLTAQPLAERNNLVGAAVKSISNAKSISSVKSKGDVDQESLRLLADRVPTKQMTGRLELALGAILRDVRDVYAGNMHEETLRTIPLQREIKKCIRERIRTAMLGKIVGSAIEIIAHYRDVFPKNTDIQIVNEALGTAGISPEERLTAKPAIDKLTQDNNNAKQNFNKKMCALIELHLGQMFDKMDTIYNPAKEPENTPKGLESIDLTEDTETTPTPVQGEKEPADKVKEAVHKAEEEMKKQLQQSINVLCEELKTATPDDYKRLLPRLLKRSIPTILKMLHLNKMFATAVADLNAETKAQFELKYALNKSNEKETEAPGNTEQATSSKQELTSSEPSKAKPVNNFPYYVKLMAKPQLPKRRVVHTFLEVFNPKSIKKHKTIHNLLFIGFESKEDFDAIVKADGVLLGRHEISIRVCESNFAKDANNLGNEEKIDGQNSKIKDELVEGDDSTTINKSMEESDIIGSDLDGQISDLLNTINDSNNDINEKSDVNKPDEIIETTEKDEAQASEDIKNDEPIEVSDTDEAKGESTEEPVEQAAENGQSEQKALPAANGQSIPEENDNKNENFVPEDGEATEEKVDQVKDLQNAVTAKSTPTRASTRLASTPATPSSIRTRRASRLMNN